MDMAFLTVSFHKPKVNEYCLTRMKGVAKHHRKLKIWMHMHVSNGQGGGKGVSMPLKEEEMETILAFFTNKLNVIN